MFARAFEIFVPSPRPAQREVPRCAKRPCPTDPDTAYKIHLGQWSLYR